MTKLQKILLAVTILLAIIVISSVLLLQRQSQMPPNPIITFSPSPTSPFPQNVKELKIVSLPTNETLNNLSVIAPITITFTSPININSLEYSIEPERAVLTEVDQTNTKLTFKPVDYWKPSTPYTLRITRLNGQDESLLRSTEINFKALVSYDEVEDAPAERSNPQQ